MSGSGPIDSEKDGKKMKIRKYILCAGIVGLVALSSGCGQKTDSGATSQAVSEQADTKENAETSGAAGAETEKETAPTVQVVTDDMVPVEADALKDGVYPVEVDSSSSMFHITEAELTVADGKMSAKLTLSGSGYGKVFMGTGEEAEKAGEGDYIQAEESADGKNVFESSQNHGELSQEAYYFIGGLLAHSKEMALITNPIVNSYKRLVPGYDAPTELTWTENNQNSLVRIPVTRGEGIRVELRSPDTSANPYVVLAICLAAGLDGIENQLEAPEPIGKNMYLLTEEQIADMNIDVLPATLGEACDAFEQDTYIQEVLGEHISKKYLEAKKAEWADYRAQVTEWEIEKYLYKI